MHILKPHISLNVSNIERSVAFYEKAFGVSASKRRPGYAKFDLREPNLNLTMTEAPRTGVNASHFGFQVAASADVAEAKARFEAAGLAIFEEENTACCYSVQDKIWIEDPDGNQWEVFVVKADAPHVSDAPMSLSAPVQISLRKREAAAPAGCCEPPTQGVAGLPGVGVSWTNNTPGDVSGKRPV